MHMYKAQSDLMQTRTQKHTLYLLINIPIMRYPTITSSGNIQGPSVSEQTHTHYFSHSLFHLFILLSLYTNDRLSSAPTEGYGGLPFIVLGAGRCSCLMNGAFWSWEAWSFTYFHLQPYLSHSYYETHSFSFLSHPPFHLLFSPVSSLVLSVFFPACRDGCPASKLLFPYTEMHARIDSPCCRCLSNIYSYKTKKHSTFFSQVYSVFMTVWSFNEEGDMSFVWLVKEQRSLTDFCKILEAERTNTWVAWKLLLQYNAI